MSITLEQFKALKPGDKVRIIKIDNGRPIHWNHQGLMDKYAGQVVTITEFVYFNGFKTKCTENWHWLYSDIDSIVVRDGLEYSSIFLSSRCSGKHLDQLDAYRYLVHDCSLIGHLHKPAEKPLIQIDKVIFNDPATIVFWKDGTKTVVKAGKDEYFDKEKGLAMAISKKVLGNKGNYYNTFKKHDAVDADEEIYVPLSLVKECTTLKKLKSLIKFMED